jgi:RHS repeat-associated protein
MPENGNNHRRRDTFSYHTSGPQTGYRSHTVIDSGGHNLTTAYEYDAVGNITRVIDPQGNDRQYEFNSLNQVVRFTSREVSPGGPRYTRDYAYDANNNLIRIDIENRDADGVLQDNTHFTVTFAYEVLNRRILMTEEVSADHFITTEYAYDGNRNRTLVRYGEAVNGNQANNTRSYKYDERDLLYQETKAPDDPGRSTTQRDYDGNGNLIRIAQGLEDTPRILLHTYDGYDRRVETRDAMGNRTLRSFDENNNTVRRQIFGELLDVPGDLNNVRLRDVQMTYDPLNRQTRVDEQFFDTTTQAPIADGLVTTTTDYADNSKRLRVTDDNSHTRSWTYDTANRLSSKSDHLNNTTRYTYNANSQIIAMEEIERSTVGGPDETFVSTMVYDGLDRLIRAVDSGGNIREYAYDSRHNRTRAFDALRPDNANDPGNLVRFEYDGINRRIATHRVLTDDGNGAGVPVGEISTHMVWDDSSRLVAQIDDSGNETRMTFDALDRPQTVTYADGTQLIRTFDVHHNMVTYTDANGNQVALDYDLDNRQINRTVQPGPGVSDETTFESLRYDGLSRLVSGEDNDSLILFQYNSMSRIVSETLNGQETRRNLDGVGNNLETTYPGGLIITQTFDELDRFTTISDNQGMSASYGYVGPRRIVQRNYRNETRMSLNYDSARRPIETRHTFRPEGEDQAFDHRTYQWDRMHNKTMRRNELTLAETGFRYDSVYRMVEAADALDGAPLASRSYDFDGVGNRETVNGGADPGKYTMSDGEPEPNDAPVNQYTTTPFEARVYDANGNLIAQEDEHIVTTVYNYRNRPVLREVSGGNQEQRYRYDVLGRRIEKTIVDDDTQDTTRYFYHGNQVAEEQNEISQTTASYVYGAYIDEVLAMHRNGELYYFHQDDQFNIVKATNAAGVVVEAYAYDDYGTPNFFNGTGQSITQSAIGNPYLFTGRRFDQESGLYYYRMRYYDTRSGRFTTRDPIGIWGDLMNVGNGYTYSSNNPWSLVDPFGLYCTGDPLVDNQEFRDKVQEALDKMKGHEPYSGRTPPGDDDCSNDGPHWVPTHEGTTLRETGFSGVGENGSYEFSDISILGPVGGDLIYPSNSNCRLHTHPSHDTLRDVDYEYQDGYGLPIPKQDDKDSAFNNPIEYDFIATEDYLVRYDKLGNIIDSWRIDDLEETCCNE